VVIRGLGCREAYGFLTFPSICRLNLKFGRSAILTYFIGWLLSVRNAIDDSGFLDQVIGIDLSDLGQVTGIALSCLGMSRGVCFLTFPSICRLNLKFESSAIYNIFVTLVDLCAMQSTIWVFWVRL